MKTVDTRIYSDGECGVSTPEHDRGRVPEDVQRARIKAEEAMIRAAGINPRHTHCTAQMADLVFEGRAAAAKKIWEKKRSEFYRGQKK